MEMVKQAIKFDLEDLQIKHEQEPILTEMIHAVRKPQSWKNKNLYKVVKAFVIDNVIKQLYEVKL